MIYSFKEQRQDIITEIELLFSSYSSHVIYDSSGKLLQVISGLDLFSQVGANTPLVIEDLRMLVGREGELSIRLEGVTGAAILCGISIRKETTATCMLLSNLFVSWTILPNFFTTLITAFVF